MYIGRRLRIETSSAVERSFRWMLGTHGGWILSGTLILTTVCLLFVQNR
jgi:hypothetical protein